MSTLIKLRRDTAANWAATDPVLQLGEPGYDTTNNELRIGTGTTPWSGLTPIAGGGGGGLPLANGTSNFNIATANGNATVTSAGNTWTFATGGTTIFPTLTITRGDTTGSLTGQALLFGDSTQEALISTPNGVANVTPNSQRLVINPGAGADGTTGEGGDIYLYAGRGGNAGGSGGDIKIRGGLGPVNGDGGYINMEGGEATADGVGGYIEIFGGQSGNAAGGTLYIQGGYGRTGGDANVSGGYGATGPGGDVSIIGGGSANGQAEYGNVIVATGSKNWTFDNTGNLVLPQGGIVYETNIPDGGLSGSTVALKPSGGSNADQQLLIYPTVTDANHLHLTSGNLYNTELFLGDDNLYVKLANTGAVVINSNDGAGNTAQWNFDSVGNLTLPGNTFAVNYANGDPVVISGGGSAGLPLANGTSNFNIATANGNATITATGNNTWTFDTTGNLTTVGNTFINTLATTIGLGSGGNVLYFNGDFCSLTLPGDANGNASIRTGTSSNQNLLLHPDGTGQVYIKGGVVNGPLLHLVSDVANANNRIQIDTYGNANTLGGSIQGVHIRGTANVPLAALTGDRLCSVSGGAYDGTNPSGPVARMSIHAFDNWAPGNVPSQIRFYTTGYNDGSNPILNMTISPTGNVDILNGNLIVSGGSGYLQGNTVTGNDALYAGSANFVPLGSNVVAQFGANSNSYSQINFQNINNGTLASTDYVLTANNGTDTTYFVDLGITGNNHSDGAFFGDTTTANDAYLYVVGSAATGPGGTAAGNLIIGSTNGTIKMFVGNTAQANVVQTISSTGVSVTGNITGNYFIGNGSQLTDIITWVTAPVANTSPGTAGQAAYDVGGNLYICVTANTWSKFTGTTSW